MSPRPPVSRILKRHGLNRRKDLEPVEPVLRYERDKPGELPHIDIKTRGRFERPGHRVTGDRKGQSNSRGIGREYVHVRIDDHSRVAFGQILPNEKKKAPSPSSRPPSLTTGALASTSSG